MIVTDHARLHRKRDEMNERSRARGAGRFAAVMAGMLIVAACSNSNDSSSPTTATSAASTTAAVATTAAASTTAAAAGSSTPATTAAASTTTTVDLTKNVPLKDVPGVTDTEIRFASLGTNSNNPTGTCVLDCLDQGVKAYFAYRNDQGGIWGRKLVLSKEVDDGLSANQAKALEIISANDTFATFNATQFPSGWAELGKAKIPSYAFAIWAAQMKGFSSWFGNLGVYCDTCPLRDLAYVAKLVGAKSVGVLGYGISPNSKQAAANARATIERYSAQIGGTKVGYFNDGIQYGLPNGIGPEVTAMKDANVDLIVTAMDLNAEKVLAQEMKRQGIRDKAVIFHANLYDQAFVKAAGDLFVGDYIQAQFRPFEASPNEASKLYQQYMQKQGKPMTEVSMVGWIIADLAYRGLEAAGPEFSREKVIDATNKLTAFTAGGLTEEVDWSRQHEPPTLDDPATHGAKQECFPIVKVEADTSFSVVGDPAKPWMCWPGNTFEWSEPVPTDFS